MKIIARIGKKRVSLWQDNKRNIGTVGGTASDIDIVCDTFLITIRDDNNWPIACIWADEIQKGK